MEDDKKLYDKFLNNDEEAFNALIIKYKKNLIYFITRYVKSIDIAEDIFQEVVLYIWSKKETYNSKYSFKTYLYTIAKSKSFNYIKKNKINTSSLEDIENISLDVDLLEQIILSNDRKNKIKEVIRKLKKDYQLVIYLTQIEGLSYKDTSIIMNKSEKQIKNLTYNAKKMLKKLLLQERIIEMKNNKFIRLLSWIIIISIITSGIVVGVKLINKKTNNAELTPSFTGYIGNISGNKVWVGSFQLAWNEFINQLGGPIEFENDTSELANELNKQSFSKEMLNENSYYIATRYNFAKFKRKNRK